MEDSKNFKLFSIDNKVDSKGEVFKENNSCTLVTFLKATDYQLTFPLLDSNQSKICPAPRCRSNNRYCFSSISISANQIK